MHHREETNEADENQIDKMTLAVVALASSRSQRVPQALHSQPSSSIARYIPLHARKNPFQTHPHMSVILMSEYTGE